MDEGRTRRVRRNAAKTLVLRDAVAYASEVNPFDGPYRNERAPGTLIFVDWSGSVEWEGPPQRPDVSMTAAEEPGRWWRHVPLSVHVRHCLHRGHSLTEIADLTGVPEAVVARLVAAELCPQPVRVDVVQQSTPRGAAIAVGARQ